MRNIIVLLSALSLAGCGGSSDPEKTVAVPSAIIKPMTVQAVIPKDLSSVFFHVGLYQNGATDIKYIEKNSSYGLNLTVLNKHDQYQDKISHKLNYTDANGNIYSENYVVDVQNKLLIKVNESILHKDQTYKTFNYNGQYIQFDFNLEKGQERIQKFNVNTYDSASHELLVIPTKVTTKYLGLDNLDINNTRYNAGKFETIEELGHFKATITTWFNINNGIVLKQLKIIKNSKNNTLETDAINIVDSSINYSSVYNNITFTKFNRTRDSENNEFITNVVYGDSSVTDGVDTFIIKKG
ncbi:hypothetical protein [Photobacterium kishitanii]|uniref:hypothetical protein n=1 Tax=Photobacterium kishitanii TaxID=318456 RepID=UPI000433F79F